MTPVEEFSQDIPLPREGDAECNDERDSEEDEPRRQLDRCAAAQPSSRRQIRHREIIEARRHPQLMITTGRVELGKVA